MKGLLVAVLFLAVYVGSLLWKNNEIEKNRNVYIPTTYELQKDKGIPVYIDEVSQGKFQSFTTVSGVLSKGTLISSVSPSVKRKIKLGENAKIELRDGKTIINGKVTGISSSPNVLTGLYDIKVSFSPKETKDIKDITVDIPISEIPNVLLVPREAVNNRGEKPVVFVVEDNKLIKREVEIAGANADVYWIKKGVSLDQKVIISDSRYFDGGEFVKVMNETRNEL